MDNIVLIFIIYIIIGIVTNIIVKLLFDELETLLVLIGLFWPIFYLIGLLLFVYRVVPKSIACEIRRLFHVK